MSRLSFRPRPLDIHKKLPVVKSIKEFEDDDTPRSSLLLLQRHLHEPEVETPQPPTRKHSQEIPTPEFSFVDTYETDYTRTFGQPTSYIRGRGARAEISDFVEYDLDDEDEDWLEDFNRESKILTPEKLEIILFKLEILDHKARERAGIVMLTFGSPVPVILHFDAAMEALMSLSIRYSVFQAVFNYWKSKRDRWQKPVLRCLQPPPPVNDTNPYNVFRPREKAHRLHTRRMQRRENNIQSFEKLRLVRRNLDHARTLFESLIKREEVKREIMECEVNLQRVQMQYKHDPLLFEDAAALSSRFGSSEDDYADSDDTATGQTYVRPSAGHAQFPHSRLGNVPVLRIKRDFKRSPLPNGFHRKKDLEEPFFLFTRPLDADKLAAAGIVPPTAMPTQNGSAEATYGFHGRIGRGGRIIFDRCNPLLRTPISHDNGPFL